MAGLAQQGERSTALPYTMPYAITIGDFFGAANPHGFVLWGSRHARYPRMKITSGNDVFLQFVHVDRGTADTVSDPVSVP